MITVDPDAKGIIRNPEYYVMKHFAHDVVPGARRVGLSGAWSGKAVAFRNPDNSLVIVINNPFKDSRDLHLAYEGQTLRFELESDSFNSIIIPQS